MHLLLLLLRLLLMLQLGPDLAQLGQGHSSIGQAVRQLPTEGLSALQPTVQRCCARLGLLHAAPDRRRIVEQLGQRHRHGAAGPAA